MRWLRDTVAGVRSDGAGYVVDLVDGDERRRRPRRLRAWGTTGVEPADQTADADRRQPHAPGSTYVPPAFTADADLSALAPGEDVIVRGMGLAAVDLVVLLAEGRGGRFVRERATATLRYEPSGLEPRLHIGSRRGVPYRSKVSSAIQGDPPQLEVAHEGVRSPQLVARPEPVDFERDVWPLIAQELAWGHYRELFTGHPERVTGTWDEFRAVLRDHARRRHPSCDGRPSGSCPTRSTGSTCPRSIVRSARRPSRPTKTCSAASVVTSRDDLTLRTTQERSSAQAVFLADPAVVPRARRRPAGEVERPVACASALPVTWHTFFSYVASGPPAHRLEELLALSHAGVVRFLGPEVEVRIEPRPRIRGIQPARCRVRPSRQRSSTRGCPARARP